MGKLGKGQLVLDVNSSLKGASDFLEETTGKKQKCGLRGPWLGLGTEEGKGTRCRGHEEEGETENMSIMEVRGVATLHGDPKFPTSQFLLRSLIP